MSKCLCGCGQPVSKPGNKYINGHNTKRKKLISDHNLGTNVPAIIPEITAEMRRSKRELKIKVLLKDIEDIKNNIPPVKNEYMEIYNSACRLTEMVRILMGKGGKKHYDTILKLLNQVYMIYLYIFFEGNIDITS